MMHKKAGFLFIIVIIFLTLICISCVKDDLLENYEGLPKTTAGMVIKKIRFQDIRSNRQAFQSLQNFRKTNSLTQRGRYYEEFGVFIDTATIVSIEKDNKHSLTFRIINDEKTNTIENLVLQANDNDSYTAYITTYDVTEQEQQQLLNGETLLPKKPSAITKTTTNSRISIGGDGAECAEIHSIQREECPDGKGGYIPFTGENNNNCAGMPVTVTYLVVTINLECMSGGGGSNPGTGPGTPYPGSNPGGTNPGGNGTSPGTQPGNPGTPPDPTEPIRDPGDGTPVITTPVLNVDPKRTHLLELHKITNENYNVRLEIDDFKDNLDYLMEQGVEFNTNSAPFPAQNNVYNGVKFFPVSQNNPVIRLHKHHNELHPVFSAEDILGMTAFFLEKKQIDENNAGTISFIMVSKMGLHAFRVSDMAEAEHFSGIYPTNNAKEIFIDAYVKEVIIESIKECNCTSGAVFDQLLFDNFITFFKGFVWGFDYFYAPHPVNPTDNYTWTKKS